MTPADGAPVKPAAAAKPAKATKPAKPAKAAKATKPAKPPRTPRPPRERTRAAGRTRALVGAVIGSLGLLLSLILAVGVLFVALDAGRDGDFFGRWSAVCDALIGPLKDLFEFSGTEAQNKQAMVGWGLGSMGYLLVGRFVQSVLQRDDAGDE